VADRLALGAFRAGREAEIDGCVREVLAGEMLRLLAQQWATDRLESLYGAVAKGARFGPIATELRRLADQLDPPEAA
jgi:hypothetical protein